MNRSSPRGPTLPRVRGSRVGDPPRVRLEALEVRLDIVCSGSAAAELVESVAAAWDWCSVDPLGDAADGDVQRLTVLLDEDPEVLAVKGPEASLFGSDLPTLMDRLSPMVTRVVVNDRRGDLV